MKVLFGYHFGWKVLQQRAKTFGQLAVPEASILIKEHSWGSRSGHVNQLGGRTTKGEGILRALSIASSFGQNGVKTRENSKKSTPTDSSNGQICQGNEQ